MSIKAILIDHDGTLVESESNHWQMWAGILETYDVTLTKDFYQIHYAGIPTPINAVDMVRRFDLKIRSDQLIKQKNTVTRKHLSLSAFPLLPHALESIQLLHRQGLQIAIVTGASREGLDSTVSSYNLDKYLSCLVTGDDVINSKPAPDCYLLAMQKLGVSADECIAIEDTEHGVNAATTAGIPCLAVPTEMSRHHDFTAATHLSGDILEATSWILDRL